MKQTITAYDFERAFYDAGRGNSFTYNGLRALFDYLEEGEGGGEEMELDVVGIDCDFCEYETAVKCVEDGGYTELDGDEAEKEEQAIEYLQDYTSIITFEGGIIIQNF